MMRTKRQDTDRWVERDTLLVLADDGQVEAFLRERYPDLNIICRETFLSGIAAIPETSPRAVFACMDLSGERMDDALAGLREAVGEHTRLLLCCDAAVEPAAREALQHGVDDYLICPLEGEEVDRQLGITAPNRLAGALASTVPALSMTEFEALGEIIAGLDGDPRTVLRRVADWIRLCSGADSVALAVDGTLAQSGPAMTEPLLVEAIRTSDNEALGQITLGARPDRPYGPADSVKLRTCAAVSSHLIQAALRHRRWRDLAHTDELSGLPNRRYLLKFLDEAMERAVKDRTRVTLLIFDIDDFKMYNDHCGHDAGDEIIKLAGRLFRKNCRDHDVVTRFGGDEFAVVFWDAEGRRAAESRHPSDAFEVLGRFTQDLNSAGVDKLKSLPDAQLTISGGLATFPWDATTRDELIVQADKALLRAKAAGKNRVLTIGQVEDDDNGEGAAEASSDASSDATADAAD